jgi:hypothetical protein
MKRLLVIVAATLLSTAALADTGGNRPAGPCKADAEKLCAGIQPGGGRIAACLREHKDQVSDACKAKFQSRRGHRRPAATDSSSGSTD